MARPLKAYYDAYWDADASGWSPVALEVLPFERELIERYATGRVLDIGCGNGRLAAATTAVPADYEGIDLSAEAVALCQDKGINATCHDLGEGLPFATAAFDTAMCFEVLEHLFDPAGIAAEAHRVLKPGGAFIGSVPNHLFVASRLLALCGYFAAGGSPETSMAAPWRDPHIRFFSAATLRAMLAQEGGFAEVRILGAPFAPLQFPVLWQSRGRARKALAVAGRPFAVLGPAWPSLWSQRLYFVARKDA
jgi:SAM-dependent methyltransferase